MKRLAKGKVLVVRTCASDLSSSYGFVWPKKGPVECPDWKKTATCGHGLHGLLWGAGDGSLMNWLADAKWLIVEVDASDVIAIDGGQKVKFPRGRVLFSGDRVDALKFLDEFPQAHQHVVHGAARAAGNRGTATAGYNGTATAGNHGTATAGYNGTATAGNHGTATAGNRGTATAGNDGTATAGNRGTATAGNDGTATAGNHGTATAGNDGVLVIHRYDAIKRRYTIKVAEIGIDGIEPNVPYRLNDAGEFIRVGDPVAAAS